MRSSKKDNMSYLKVPPITNALKLPASATSIPTTGLPHDIVSQQLGLVTAALSSETPVTLLADALKNAPSIYDTTEFDRDDVLSSDKGILSGLLRPKRLFKALKNPKGATEKLAAVTNALKTGNPIDAATRLLGYGALPVPGASSVFNSLSALKGALELGKLLPVGIEGMKSFFPTEELPVLTAETISSALVTVTKALKSSNLISDIAAPETLIIPVPISEIVPSSGKSQKLSPVAISEAFDTLTHALQTGDLIPSETLPLADLPLPILDNVKNALQTITDALHAKDMVVDAASHPAIILPAPLAENVSDILATITSALTSEKSASDVRQLVSAAGIPNPITEVIADTLEKVDTLPPEIAGTVKETLGAISETIRSGDQLLDAAGLPESALAAPITSAVSETLDTVAALPTPVANAVSGILDSIANAVSGDTSSPVTEFEASKLGAENVSDTAEPTADALGFDVPDADNSTNRNPQPDGHKGKRIIICCDGTWQDSDQGDAGSPTNVTRIARAVKSVSDDGVAQIIYYQSGVGSTYASKFGRLLAGGTGLGLSEHVREAFVFISNNYHVQDEIFILGFSRGAFTARSIAGLIGRIGVLTRRGMESFGKIYEDYINFKLRDQSYIDQQDWETIKGVTIKAIGVWDTVGSLGIPSSPVVEKSKCNDKYKFHDTDLTSMTENAFHVLALDEHRLPFTPTLWRLPVPAPSENFTNIVPNLKQVWFPGVHTNVGGGYADQELADITLVWMIDQLAPFLGFDINYVKSLSDVNGLNRWASGNIYNSFNGVMKVTGSKVRTPGGYFPNPPKSVIKRALTFGQGLFGQPGITSITNEEIHPSVRGRMVASDGQWCSRALFGWTCEKRVVQSATGPVERWIWKNPTSRTELLESNLGQQESLLAGTEVLTKLKELDAVPIRLKKGFKMDKGAVDSKWLEHPE